MPILIITANPEIPEQHTAQAIELEDYNSSQELRDELHKVADVFYSPNENAPMDQKDYEAIINSAIRLDTPEKYQPSN